MIIEYSAVRMYAFKPELGVVICDGVHYRDVLNVFVER